MTNIARNAARVLRGVFIFRLFIVAFGVLVFAIRWSVLPPPEAIESLPRVGFLSLLVLGFNLASVLFQCINCLSCDVRYLFPSAACSGAALHLFSNCVGQLVWLLSAWCINGLHLLAIVAIQA